MVGRRLACFLAWCLRMIYREIPQKFLPLVFSGLFIFLGWLAQWVINIIAWLPNVVLTSSRWIVCALIVLIDSHSMGSILRGWAAVVGWLWWCLPPLQQWQDLGIKRENYYPPWYLTCRIPKTVDFSVLSSKKEPLEATCLLLWHEILERDEKGFLS